MILIKKVNKKVSNLDTFFNSGFKNLKKFWSNTRKLFDQILI